MIHVFAIDTPWAVGKVNCYLIDDDPLTLVDTGPNTGTAIVELEASMASVGRRLADVERIVVTHQHIDHCGLLSILAHLTGAEICALDTLAPWLEDGQAAMKTEDDDAAALMRRHGVPEDAVTTLQAVAGNFRSFGPSGVPVHCQLTDHGTLGFAGRSWDVLHRPGHSPTCTVFYDRERDELIGGDHVLARISSNPLITKQRPHALLDYIASQRATAALNPGTVLPGHGDPVHDVPALVQRRLAGYEKRAAKLLRLLTDGGPASAHGLAVELWGPTALQQAFLTLSEVLGHLDLLIERGDVVLDDTGDHVRFTAR